MKELIIMDISNDIKNGMKEYITLCAMEDVELSRYAILDRTFAEGNQLSNKFRHFYQLPTLTLKKGEFVQLFTCAGTDSKAQFTGETGGKTRTVHKFYWGLKENILNNNSKDQISLIKFEYIDGKAVPA